MFQVGRIFEGEKDGDRNGGREEREADLEDGQESEGNCSFGKSNEEEAGKQGSKFPHLGIAFFAMSRWQCRESTSQYILADSPTGPELSNCLGAG